MVVLLLSFTAAQAKLELQNVQAAYSPFWPERKTLDYYSQDMVVFRFLLKGAHANADGNLDLNISTQLTDATGKMVQFQAMPLVNGWVGKDGGMPLACSALQLNGQVPPGEYTVTVKAKDNLTSEEATFSRKITIGRVGFGVICAQSFYDGEWKIPAPATVQAGQKLFYRVIITGAGVKDGRRDVHAQCTVVNAKGTEIIAARNFDLGAPEAQSLYMNVTLDLPWNCPGDYAVRFAFTDRVANKTVQYEIPVHVIAP
jgi:hypothetical protein